MKPDERDAQVLRVIRVFMLTVALLLIALTTTIDPDLWGHVQFGRDIVAARAVQIQDPYSFTSDRPWINHEWLAEVAMYGAFALAGGAGLVALKMIILVGVLACIFAVLRHRTWRPADHDFLITVALFGMLARCQPVRPQLFSLLLFACLLLALVNADRGRHRSLFLVPVLFAAWANLHGGFLVGLGVLAVWISIRWLQTPSRWRSLLALGLASPLATLVTPYGVHLWRFLAETVGLSRPYIVDWMPIYAHPSLYLPWLLIVLTLAVALWRARGRINPASLAIVAVLGVASFRLSRIDAFFAIAVVMLCGHAFARPALGATSALKWRPLTLATAALIPVSMVALFARPATCIDVDSSLPKGWLHYVFNVQPTSFGVPEPEAATFLKQQRGRMLAFFDWGEYAIWHFPNLKVSIDGRRETVYSHDLIEAHNRFFLGASTSLVERLQPDVIWLPARLRVVQALEREGWQPAFRGPVSVVLVRSTGGQLQQVTDLWQGRRCFPRE